MRQRKQSTAKFKGKLPELPKITPIDESIHILEETVAVLQLKIAELKARQKPYCGNFEMAINPLNGEIGNGKRKSKPKKRKPDSV